MKKLIIACISSEWHLYGMESFLSKCRDNQSNVIVFSEFHAGSNSFRVNKDKINFLKDRDYKLYYIDNTREQFDFILNLISKEIFEKRIDFITIITAGKLNYWLLFATKGVKRECVIVDEGVGTYYSKKLWNAEVDILSRNKGKGKLKNNVKDAIKIVFDIVYKRHIVKRLIFRKQRREFYPNYDIIKDYRNYFYTYKKRSNERGNKVSETIFLSDNLDMMLKKEITEQEIFFVYKTLFDAIRKKNGDTIVIWYKPHPNERENMNPNIIKAGFSLFDKTIASEELFQLAQFKICGICSTSLITGSLIFGQDVYSFLNYIPDQMLNYYGRRKKKEFANIVKNIPQLKLVKD